MMNNYESYYAPKGKYRKFILKQESITPADMYEHLLKLKVRIKDFLSLEEAKKTDNETARKIIADAISFSQDLERETSRVFSPSYSKDAFCESYDKLASIVEGMEEKFCAYLETLPGKLSEDAHILKKRGYVQKNPQKDLARVKAATTAWKRNKGKYTKAIRKFHKSSAGKQFHRNLSRFNKMRVREEVEKFSEEDILLICKGISSFLTHLLIEIQNTTTQAVETVLNAPPEEITAYKELFHIYQGLLEGMFENYFEKDREMIADILEVVEGYYEIVEGM